MDQALFTLYMQDSKLNQDLYGIPAELLCKKKTTPRVLNCRISKYEGSHLQFTSEKGEKTRSRCIVSKFTYREISQQAIEPSAADSLRHHNLYARLCFSRGHTDNLFVPQPNAATWAAGTREMKNKREHCLQPCQTA